MGLLSRKPETFIPEPVKTRYMPCPSFDDPKIYISFFAVFKVKFLKVNFPIFFIFTFTPGKVYYFFGDLGYSPRKKHFAALETGTLFPNSAQAEFAGFGSGPWVRLGIPGAKADLWLTAFGKSGLYRCQSRSFRPTLLPPRSFRPSR